MIECDYSHFILVPRGRDPFGQHQESRPLASSNFWAWAKKSFCSFQPIRFVRFDNESANRGLLVLGAVLVLVLVVFQLNGIPLISTASGLRHLFGAALINFFVPNAALIWVNTVLAETNWWPLIRLHLQAMLYPISKFILRPFMREIGT